MWQNQDQNWVVWLPSSSFGLVKWLIYPHGAHSPPRPPAPDLTKSLKLVLSGSKMK